MTPHILSYSSGRSSTGRIGGCNPLDVGSKLIKFNENPAVQNIKIF